MKRLSVVFCLTLVFAFVEFAGAYFSNSLSLASDGIHMLIDVGGIGLAWIIGWFVVRQNESSFRSERLEMRGDYLNGILLALVSLGIAISAISRVSHPSEVRSGIMMGVAGTGLGVNLVSLFLLRNLQRKNLIRGAYQHILGDAATSVGVVVAALLIHWTGSTLIDPLVGIGVACFVLWRAQDLIRDARRALVASRAREAKAQELEGTRKLREVQELRKTREFEDLRLLVSHVAEHNKVHGLCCTGQNGTKAVTFHLVVLKGHPQKVEKHILEQLGMRGIEATIELCGKGCRQRERV